MLNKYESFKKINKHLLKIGYKIEVSYQSDRTKIYRLMEWKDEGYYGKNIFVECGIYYKKHEMINDLQKLFD